jgi:hypothetical protein
VYLYVIFKARTRVKERRNRVRIIFTSLLRMLLSGRQLFKIRINLTPGTEAAVTLREEKINLGIFPSLEAVPNALNLRD